MAKYHLRYFFEWGGPCLWTDNDAARERFGYAINLDDLPLSDRTKSRMIELVDWHDRSINTDYPSDPSPWRQTECNQFNDSAKKLLRIIQAELGEDFKVRGDQNILSEDPDLDKYLKNPKGFVRN